MKNNIFIDTNILVYSYTIDSISKHDKAKKLLQKDLANANIIISAQILNEFYVVMSKSKNNLTHKEIVFKMREIIEQTYVTSIKLETISVCLKIKDKYKYSWWDSLVLTSALENDCRIVYSEDMQHGQIIENSLKIINPFVELVAGIKE